MGKWTGVMLGLAIAGSASFSLADDGQGDRVGRHGGRRGLDRAQLLEKYDANHNGVLDPEERDAARQEFQGQRGGRRAEMLQRFDTNKNGTLDPQEREAMKAARQERRAEMLKRFDTDGDGQLSPAERETLRKTMREEHRGRQP